MSSGHTLGQRSKPGTTRYELVWALMEQGQKHGGPDQPIPGCTWLASLAQGGSAWQLGERWAVYGI